VAAHLQWNVFGVFGLKVMLKLNTDF